MGVTTDLQRTFWKNIAAGYQLHVPEERVREIVIEALVSNEPYVVKIPKGCIV